MHASVGICSSAVNPHSGHVIAEFVSASTVTPTPNVKSSGRGPSGPSRLQRIVGRQQCPTLASAQLLSDIFPDEYGGGISHLLLSLGVKN